VINDRISSFLRLNNNPLGAYIPQHMNGIKKRGIYAPNGILFNLKKEEILSFITIQINLEDIMSN